MPGLDEGVEDLNTSNYILIFHVGLPPAIQSKGFLKSYKTISVNLKSNLAFLSKECHSLKKCFSPKTSQV